MKFTKKSGGEEYIICRRCGIKRNIQEASKCPICQSSRHHFKKYTK